MGSVASWTCHSTYAFVRKNVAQGYDIMKFDADTILFGEIQCKKEIF